MSTGAPCLRSQPANRGPDLRPMCRFHSRIMSTASNEAPAKELTITSAPSPVLVGLATVDDEAHLAAVFDRPFDAKRCQFIRAHGSLVTQARIVAAAKSPSDSAAAIIRPTSERISASRAFGLPVPSSRPMPAQVRANETSRVGFGSPICCERSGSRTT